MQKNPFHHPWIRANGRRVALVIGIVLVALAVGMYALKKGNPSLPEAPRVFVTAASQPEQPPYVSIEALDQQAKQGYTRIRIPLLATQEGMLVCMAGPINLRRGQTISQEEFSRLTSALAPAPCTWETLKPWLEQHPNVSLVVSFPGWQANNAFRYIAGQMGENTSRIIPEIPGPKLAATLKQAGYSEIIWRPGKKQAQRVSDALNTARKNGISTVALPARLARQAALTRRANEKDTVTIYALNVNTCDQYKQLRGSGVEGIYTSSLSYGECPAR